MSLPRVEPYELFTAEELPQNRLGWSVDSSRAALLIHDVQEHFLRIFSPDSSPMQPMLANIQRLKAACERAGVPVVYTAQPGVQSASDRGLLQELWGPGITARPDLASITPSLTPSGQDAVLTKWRYSAFVRTPLRTWLDARQRDQLLICGVYAHIGCQATACDAFMQDLRPVVIADAVADFSRAHHLNALKYVAECCGLVGTTERVLSAIQPGTPGVEATLRVQVAELLQISPHQISPDDNLLDWGLDSVRMMTLVERLSGEGAQLDMLELVAQPTLSAWASLVKQASQRATP